MELPAVTVKALDSVAHNLVQSTGANDTAVTRLKMVLLEDQAGKLQAICRHTDLLDIDALNQQLGRQLRLLSRVERMRLYERLGVAQLPALPSVTGWPTVVDGRADEAAEVSIASGAAGEQVALSQEAFQQLTTSAKRLSFGISPSVIHVNHDHPERDREQLNSALKRLTSLRIQQRLEDTLELPPLPETAQRIIRLRVNPNASTGELVDIVESDPSLAAQVVSWASSSFYAGGQVNSVHDAVVRVLGFDLVMNLAMGLSLGRALKAPTDEPEGYVGYWQQAVWQAQAAGVLASIMPRGQRPVFGLAYLGGLLHNFGYLVLSHVFPPHFKLACRFWEVNPHLDTSVIEQHLFGVTREQIGSQLLANWGMPDEVVQAVRNQKNPDYSGEQAVYSQVLWLGRQLLTARGIPLGPQEQMPDSVFQRLGLDRDEVEEQFDLLVDSGDSILGMAGMMQGK